MLRIPVSILRDLRTNHNAKHVVSSHLGNSLLLRIVGGCNHRLPMEAYHLLQHSCSHMAIISIPYLTLLNANDTYVDSPPIWRLIGGCDSPAEDSIKPKTLAHHYLMTSLHRQRRHASG